MAPSSGQRDKAYEIMFPRARRKKDTRDTCYIYIIYDSLFLPVPLKWDEESRSGNNPAANDNADRFNDNVIVMWKPRLEREVNGGGGTRSAPLMPMARFHAEIISENSRSNIKPVRILLEAYY